MKVKILFVLSVLYLNLGISDAQNMNSKFIGVETGMVFLNTKMLAKDYIRKETAPFYNEESQAGYINSSMYIFYGGLKSEFLFFNNKFGIITGLRHTITSSSIGNRNSSNNDFFYLLCNQGETTTEYVKIKKATQISNYIGIPLEAKFYPLIHKKFRLYFKIGADFNYLLQSKINVEYVDNTMKTDKKAVVDKFGLPNSFYSSIYASIGFRFGKSSSYSFEFCFPSLILSSGASTLVTPIPIASIQFNYLYPLKSKEK
jgi:hypothetical protein